MTYLARTAVAIAVATVSLGAQPDTGNRLALSGGRIYASPEAAPINDGAVLIEAGRIVAVGPRAKVVVPEGVRTLDCTGLAIVAGFQNSHVHFTDDGRWSGAASRPAGELAASLTSMLTRYGFTTVVDTASDLNNTMALRRRIESRDVPGPRILTAGLALYPADGVPYYVRNSVPPEVLSILPQPRQASDAAAIVRRQLQQGGDVVKLFTGSWVERGTVKPMDLDVAAAAVSEAHRLGKPVFAHASNLAGLQVAMRAGVDVLAHALDDTRGLTRAHLKDLHRLRIGMVPTLALFRGDPDVLDEVRNFSRLGGDILFGTDVGYLPDFDHAAEYRLMAAAGLGWREVLASLTTTPARRFGEASVRGTVAPGMAGDVVVLAADPKVDVPDVESFARVRYTIRGGHVIYAAAGPAETDAVAELTEMQKRLRQALLTRQRDEYASMLAPEWRVSHVDGRMLTKAQVLEMMFTGSESPIAEAAQDDVEVRTFGDSAVVTGRSTFKARDGSIVVLRFTDFVVKRNGRWQVVASHATPVR